MPQGGAVFQGNIPQTKATMQVQALQFVWEIFLT